MRERKDGEITVYGRRIVGTARNHHQAVRVDVTGGCVGITQFGEGVTVANRVLLTPQQWAEIVGFVTKRKAGAR